MDGTDEVRDVIEQVVQHLEAALEAEDMDEVKYHLRQALQMLRIHE